MAAAEMSPNFWDRTSWSESERWTAGDQALFGVRFGNEMTYGEDRRCEIHDHVLRPELIRIEEPEAHNGYRCANRRDASSRERRASRFRRA